MRDSDIRRWTHPETILVATDLSDLDHLMPFAIEAGGQYRGLHHSPACTLHHFGLYRRCRRHALLRHRWRPGDRGADDASLVRSCRPSRHSLPFPGPRRPSHTTDCSRRSASFMPTACCSELGAGASSAGCSSALWQNKCCARSTSRSSPWDPRLISRWTGARNGSSCMPPHFERPLARARRLPARWLLPKRQNSFCCTSCRPSQRWSARACPQECTLRPCSSCASSPRKPAPGSPRTGLRPWGGEPIAAPPSSRSWPTAIHLSRFSLWPPNAAPASSCSAPRTARLSRILTRDHTVHRVLAHARCPVLTLREHQAMPEETHTVAASAHR